MDSNTLSNLIKSGRINDAIKMVETGQPLTKEENCKSTPIRLGIRYGNTKLVRLMLNKGCSVDSSIEGNHQLLLHSIIFGDSEKLPLMLIKAGVDIYEDTKEILINACHNNFINVITILLSRSREDGYVSKFKDIVKYIILSNKTEIAKIFIENGISLYMPVDEINSIEMLNLLVDTYGLKFINDNINLVNIIKYHNCNIEVIAKIIILLNNPATNNKIFYYAVDINSARLVTLLLDLGADPNYRNPKMVSALQHAKNIPKLKGMYDLIVNYRPPDELKEPDLD